MTHSTNTQQAPRSFNCNILDEQAVAQAELYSHLEAQAQVVAPEQLTSVEISFYEHEIYANDQLIAKITHDDDDFVTQRWLVMVNDQEVHRANTWAKCHSHIFWHYKQGALPVQEAEEAATTTDNKVMSEIAGICDGFGFDVTDDGEIYHNDQKLGSVGCTNGRWWITRVLSAAQNQVPCDSAFDAVWSLSMVEVLPSVQAVSCEELLDLPFDELTALEWERLKKDSSRELIAA